MIKVQAFMAEQFTYFVQKLKSYADGAYSLLDNTAVVLSTQNGTSTQVQFAIMDHPKFNTPVRRRRRRRRALEDRPGHRLQRPQPQRRVPQHRPRLRHEGEHRRQPGLVQGPDAGLRGLSRRPSTGPLTDARSRRPSHRPGARAVCCWGRLLLRGGRPAGRRRPARRRRPSRRRRCPGAPHPLWARTGLPGRPVLRARLQRLRRGRGAGGGRSPPQLRAHADGRMSPAGGWPSRSPPAAARCGRRPAFSRSRATPRALAAGVAPDLRHHRRPARPLLGQPGLRRSCAGRRAARRTSPGWRWARGFGCAANRQGIHCWGKNDLGQLARPAGGGSQRQALLAPAGRSPCSWAPGSRWSATTAPIACAPGGTTAPTW